MTHSDIYTVQPQAGVLYIHSPKIERVLCQEHRDILIVCYLRGPVNSLYKVPVETESRVSGNLNNNLKRLS